MTIGTDAARAFNTPARKTHEPKRSAKKRLTTKRTKRTQPQQPAQPAGSVGLGQEFVSGFTGGVESSVGDFAAGVGYLTGSSKLREWGTDLIKDASKLPTSHVDVTSIDSPEKFGQWAAHGMGSVLGSVVSVIAGGGVVGAGTKLAVKGALKVAGKELSKKAAKGSVVGGFVAGDYATQVGSLTEVTDDGWHIAGGAVLKTMLDLIPAVPIANKLGLLREFSNGVVKKSISRRVGEGALNAVVGGAVAEGGQTAIDLTIAEAVKKGELGWLPEGARAQILDSAALGLFGVGVLHGGADIIGSSIDNHRHLKLTPEEYVSRVFGDGKKLQFLADEGVIEEPKVQALKGLIGEIIADPAAIKADDPYRYHAGLEMIANAGERARMPQVVQDDITAGLFAHHSRYGKSLTPMEHVDGGRKVIPMTPETAGSSGRMDDVDAESLTSLPSDATVYRDFIDGVDSIQDVITIDNTRLDTFQFNASGDHYVNIPNPIHDGVWTHHIQSTMSKRANVLVEKLTGDPAATAAYVGEKPVGSTPKERLSWLLKTPKMQKLLGQATYESFDVGGGAQIIQLSHQGSRLDPAVVETYSRYSTNYNAFIKQVDNFDNPDGLTPPASVSGENSIRDREQIPDNPTNLGSVGKIHQQWVSAYESVWKRLKLPEEEFLGIVTHVGSGALGTYIGNVHQFDVKVGKTIIKVGFRGDVNTFIHELSHAVTFKVVAGMPRHIWQGFYTAFKGIAGKRVTSLPVDATLRRDFNGALRTDENVVEGYVQYAASSYVEFTRYLVEHYMFKLPEIRALRGSISEIGHNFIDHIPTEVKSILQNTKLPDGTTLFAKLELAEYTDMVNGVLDILPQVSEKSREDVANLISIYDTSLQSAHRSVEDNFIKFGAEQVKLYKKLGLNTKTSEAVKVMKKLLNKSAKGYLLKYPKLLGVTRAKLRKQGFGVLQAQRLTEELVSKGGRVSLVDLRKSRFLNDYPALKALISKSPIAAGRKAKDMDGLTFLSLLHDGVQPLELRDDNVNISMYIGDFKVGKVDITSKGMEVEVVDESYREEVVRTLLQQSFSVGEHTVVIDGREYVTEQFDTTNSWKLGDTSMRDDLVKYNKFLTLGANLLQWVAMNPHLKPLADYAKVISEGITPYKAVQNKLTLEVLQSVRNLPKGQQEVLWDTLLTESTDGVFSTVKGLDKSLDELTVDELTELAKESGVVEINSGVLDSTRVNLDTVLAYKAVRKQLRDGITSVYEEFINKEEDQTIRDALTKELLGFQSKPYFPMMRFGKHVLIVNSRSSGKRVGVEFFEKVGELKARKVELSRDKDLVVHKSYKMDNTTPFTMLPRGLMEAVSSKLGVSEKQRQILKEISAEFSPDRSYRNFLRKRRGVSGFSRDGQRSFAAYMVSSTNFYTRLKYGSELQDAITELTNTASALGKTTLNSREVGKYYGIAEWLTEHMTEMFNGDKDFVRFRTFATLFYLGANVKSALVNLTQVPMFTLPVLGSKVGNALAASEITKAYRNLLSKKSDPVLERYLHRASATHLLDESLMMEVASLANTSNLERSVGGMFDQALGETGKLVMKPFHYAEVLNRRVTFEATFNAFRKKGMHPELAYNEAISMLQTTQFEYAHWNKAKFMWGKLGTVFMFWTWMQNSMALMLGVHGKAEARAALMGLVAFGGVMAVPGSEDAMKLLSYLMNSISGGKFTDIQRSTENTVKSLIGGTGSDIFLHGLASHGFGLPLILGDGADFDVSGSIGMGRFAPGLQESLRSNSPFDSTVGRVGGSLAGAAIGVPLQILKAVSSSDPWAMTGALPKAIGNPIQAYHFQDKGGVVMSDGAVIKTSPFNVTKTIFHALGLRGRDVGEAYRDNSMSVQVQQYYVAVRGTLKLQMYRAVVEDDREAIADVSKAIKRFNNSVVGTPLGISYKELQQYVKGKRRRIVRKERGVASPRYAQEIARMLQKDQ